MTANKIHRNEKLRLKGSLRKGGFDRWRFVVNGICGTSGEEKVFFIEFYTVNPMLSPKKCVFGLKNSFDSSEDDFQFVLPVSGNQKDFSARSCAVPSFFMVRAGAVSVGGCQLNSYFPAECLLSKNKEYIFSVKQNDSDECILTDNYTSGSINVTENDLSEHPEYKGSAGSISWKLRFSKKISFPHEYNSKCVNWAVIGARTDFSGTIVFNGKEFSVNPRKSFGYYDKNWGKDFSSPYFHLSSSGIISNISGGLLNSSAFAVQGEYKKKVSVLVSIEGKNIEFRADKMKRYSINYDCQEVTGSEDGVKLHWSVSVHDRRYVIDIDVFCDSKEMFLRDFESPAGGRKIMRILAGGNGTGKFKMYKKKKKTLELIEQADIIKCVCEYGNLETEEN